MRLGEYLSAKGLSAAEFAARIGVHRSTVSRWLEPADADGVVYRPSWEQCAKIRDETNGQVTADDFVDATSPPPSEAAA